MLRWKAKEGHRSHVSAGANWSMPATVHLWKSGAAGGGGVGGGGKSTVKALVGNRESWWWEDAQPTIPFTPGRPRTVTLQLNWSHLGLPDR